MIDGKGDVLYVGKAKNIRKRVANYARPVAYDARIARMVAATATLEFITTKTETEALLLEANLIKRLRPRFNVLLRDDKSFPYILITSDHWAPQILKHRGARTRKGRYYGPFASAGAVNRTINTLERAFLLRSCTDAFFEGRTRPCLLHQIKRCSAPCTGEIDFPGYGELVKQANDFLSGRIERGAEAAGERNGQGLDRARFRARRDVSRPALGALGDPGPPRHQSAQRRGSRRLRRASARRLHLRRGVLLSHRAELGQPRLFSQGGSYLRRRAPCSAPSSRSSTMTSRRRGSFWSRTISRIANCSREALCIKAERKVEVAVPKRGERKELVGHALANAREALARRLADTSSQQRLLKSLTETFGLSRAPRRIEVYDNSHIAGTNAVGALIVAGAEGFRKNQYRKFNIRSAELSPGDDYGMMREVLQRRFKRLLAEAPRLSIDAAVAAEQSGDAGEADDQASEQVWPDLVLIDGGQGQLSAATQTLAELGVTDVPLVAIAKGPDRDAGRETFFMAGKSPFKLPPRDPVLYFVERLRDEAHRFAIGSHRTRRKKDIREAGLQEIPGIGPTRKRALLRHFGTVKAIERASLPDLSQVPGINAETARKIYEFFHEQAAT